MPEVKAIKFKNFTDTDFSWKFNGAEYTFKAGEEMYMEDFKARHFAKHLIDRELNKKNILTNNLVERGKLEVQCFPAAEIVTPAKALDIEAKKKETKADDQNDFPKEEEFPDLDDSAVPKKAKVGRPKKADNE